MGASEDAEHVVYPAYSEGSLNDIHGIGLILTSICSQCLVMILDLHSSDASVLVCIDAWCKRAERTVSGGLLQASEAG